MTNSAVAVRGNSLAKNVALVIGASLLISICARLSFPLPFTPVPFTLANFALLAVGLVLGSKRAGLAALLYLVYGAAGVPVFSPASTGLFGVTGGYLWAFPLVAFVAGWISEHGDRSFARNLIASVAGDLVLFLGGISWLFAFTHSWQRALFLGGYWFVFAEVIKIMAAAGLASRFRRNHSIQ
ncbi:MAG TPA: biotin transporter BioY [Candidatus Koribacter sp.]|jgi:biotin transport system substrate-specific component